MPSTDDIDHWLVERRRLLGTLGTGVTLTLAGCLGDDDDGDAGTDDDDDAGTDDEDTGPDDDSEQLAEPADFPEDEACAVCNMIAGEHPEWTAQLLHGDGERTYFCSSGCLLAYAVDSEHFGGPDSAIESAWATDYETGDLIDAMEAHYVRVDDPSHVDDIMMMNPTPFADREDANAFIDELNADPDIETEYDDDDVISFADFDRDLAMLYRANFFDGDGH